MSPSCSRLGSTSGAPWFLRFCHAREFFRWFCGETLRARSAGFEAQALLGLCDRYFLLTEIIGRADMLWHGNPGESVPAGNAWLYERCREVEANPDFCRMNFFAAGRMWLKIPTVISGSRRIS